MVPSGRPAPPWARVTSEPSIVPTVRLTLRIGSTARTGSSRSSAGRHSAISSLSRARSRPWSCVTTWRRAAPAGSSGRCRTGARSRPAAFQCSTAARVSSTSTWPTASARRAEAESGEELADLLGDEGEEVLDELGLAREPLAQHRVLRRDTDRAGVEVADPHHHAAHDHQRRGGEAELLGAQQCGHDDVAAGLELAVRLDHDPVAQPVEQQRLLGLGEAELPRRAGVLERGERGCARPAVMAGHQHDVGVRLRHAGRDGADPDLGHQLHVHPCARVRVLQVVDELGQVLDRVDVVVRRR